METIEIPDGAMKYAENAGLTILNVVGRMFFDLFGNKYNLVIIAVKKNEKDKDYAVLSDLDTNAEIERVLREAARRSSSGTMLTNHDDLEPKH